MRLGCALTCIQAAALAVPKNRSLRSRFFGNPAASPCKGTPQQTKLNRKSIETAKERPSPLIRLAIGRYSFLPI
jgi:hypothetical protein